MRKPIKALVIEACKEPKETIIENPDSCGEFLELIGCDSIDCVERMIGGKAYCLTVDDEGLMKDGLPCSGVCGMRERSSGGSSSRGPRTEAEASAA